MQIQLQYYVRVQVEPPPLKADGGPRHLQAGEALVALLIS